MVRSITVFVGALVANADYICTTTPASNDCQCLTIVEVMSGQRDWLELSVFAPGAAAYNPDCSGCDVAIGQSNFTEKKGGPGGGGIAYTTSKGEDLCVSGVKEQSDMFAPLDMVPCDYKAQGGIFIRLSSPNDGQLLHIGGGAPHGHDECLEPGLGQFQKNVSIGNCSSSWTISPTPSCGAESEMVIA